MRTDVLTLARVIRTAGREIKKARDKNASSLGITSDQADALAFVCNNPGCNVKDLMGCMETSHQAACGIAERLESKGLIASDQDGRVKHLEPTEAGKDTIRRFFELGERCNRDVFGSLTDEESQELERLMSEVLSNLRRES